jgi:hypothetical protein
MQNFGVLKQVVHIATTDFTGLVFLTRNKTWAQGNNSGTFAQFLLSFPENCKTYKTIYWAQNIYFTFAYGKKVNIFLCLTSGQLHAPTALPMVQIG